VCAWAAVSILNLKYLIVFRTISFNGYIKYHIGGYN
jgi:hypothetical protein